MEFQSAAERAAARRIRLMYNRAAAAGAPDTGRQALEAFRRMEAAAVRAAAEKPTPPGLRFVRLGRAGDHVADLTVGVRALRPVATPVPMIVGEDLVDLEAFDMDECSKAAMRAQLRNRRAVGPVEDVAIVAGTGELADCRVVAVVRGNVEALRREFVDEMSKETFRQAGVPERELSGVVLGNFRLPSVTG